MYIYNIYQRNGSTDITLAVIWLEHHRTLLGYCFVNKMFQIKYLNLDLIVLVINMVNNSLFRWWFCFVLCLDFSVLNVLKLYKKNCFQYLCNCNTDNFLMFKNDNTWHKVRPTTYCTFYKMLVYDFPANHVRLYIQKHYGSKHRTRQPFSSLY